MILAAAEVGTHLRSQAAPGDVRPLEGMLLDDQDLAASDRFEQLDGYFSVRESIDFAFSSSMFNSQAIERARFGFALPLRITKSIDPLNPHATSSLELVSSNTMSRP